MSPKQRTVKNFGYLEDQEDPDAFLAELRAQIEDARNERKKINLSIDTDRLINDRNNRDLYYAPVLLEKYYDLLRLPEFFAFSFYAYSSHWWTNTAESLEEAVEEMPAGYADKMAEVISNTPALIVMLILTIPVAVLAMRIAEKVMKKQASSLK